MDQKCGNFDYELPYPVYFTLLFPLIIFARIVRPMNALQLSLAVFTQRNFVADFLQAKCDFTRTPV